MQVLMCTVSKMMSLIQACPLVLLRASYSCSVIVRSSLVHTSCSSRHGKTSERTHSGRFLVTAEDDRRKHQKYYSSESIRRSEEAKDMEILQYVGKHRQRYTSVYVWGFTYTGALGVPSFILPGRVKSKKPRKFQCSPYKLKFDDKITSAACGHGFSLIASNTLETTKVWGMGINTDSQIGYQPKTHDNGEGMHTVISPAPVDLPLTRPRKTRVTQVSCGRAHSLILTDEEGVFSLGNNSFGQCGRPIIENEDYRSNRVIHKIEGIDDKVKQVACGHDHSLFLTEAGHLYSCGWGADGQTGLGHYDSTSAPTRLEGDLKDECITQISTFADCCLAISDKGDLFGWGNSEYNQLSSVTEETQVYEPRHLRFDDIGKVTSAAAGGTICALTSDSGEVWVWGYGILGKGPVLAESVYPECIPMTLFGASATKRDVTITKVWCGLHYFAAITNKGDLYTWGTNGTGCLGLGQLNSQYFPLRVSVPGEVVNVACGVDHTIALVKTYI